jgi:hypothetical protein
MIDDRPITLAEACAMYGSTFKPCTLRAEAGRGRLVIFRIGRRDYTTAQAMQDMVRKCQDAARPHGSTSTRPEANGLSETDRISSARAALSQTVEALKKGLPNTSVTNTNRSVGRAH